MQPPEDQRNTSQPCDGVSVNEVVPQINDLISKSYQKHYPEIIPRGGPPLSTCRSVDSEITLYKTKCFILSADISEGFRVAQSLGKTQKPCPLSVPIAKLYFCVCGSARVSLLASCVTLARKGQRRRPFK